MTAPVSILAEAISSPTREVVVILVVLGAIALLLVVLFVVGIIGFFRIGRGRPASRLGMVAWPIGLIDIGMALAAIRQSFVPVTPLVAHALALAVGYATRSSPKAAPPQRFAPTVPPEPPTSPPPGEG